MKMVDINNPISKGKIYLIGHSHEISKQDLYVFSFNLFSLQNVISIILG